MQTYIAELTDRGTLGEPILWRTTSIAEAREILVNVGSWQTAPDYDGIGYGPQILLGDSAFVSLYLDDRAPWRKDDDLRERIENQTAYAVFTIGKRGGIRRLV